MNLGDFWVTDCIYASQISSGLKVFSPLHLPTIDHTAQYSLILDPALASSSHSAIRIVTPNIGQSVELGGLVQDGTLSFREHLSSGSI
jgi:hypothetical protein